MDQQIDQVSLEIEKLAFQSQLYCAESINKAFEILQNIQYYSMYSAELQKIVVQLYNSLTSGLNHSKLIGLLYKMLSQCQFFCDIHQLFLSICVKSKHYKIGYKFIKQHHFNIFCGEQKKIISGYFYYAGLIAEAEHAYEEAIRYYTISIQCGHNDYFSQSAAKMKILVCFRLCEQRSLSDLQREGNHQLDTYLSTILFDKSVNQQEFERVVLEDKDACIVECMENVKVLYVLKKKMSVYLKLSFNQILSETQLSKGSLIQTLLDINQDNNLFLINEQKEYIEFKQQYTNFKDLNKQLEDRLNIVETFGK